MFSLKDKVIVVTGSGGLLGRSIVRSIEMSEGIAIGLDIKSEAERKNNFICDTTSETDVSRKIKEICEKFGRIDGWVNNAYPRTADWANPIEDVTMDSWRTNVDLHMNSYFMCSRMILEYMKTNGFGSLINMASIYGTQGPDFTVYEGTKMTNPVGYAAIKGGIINLTKYLASYYGQFKIRVNSVSPGGVFDNQPPAFIANYEKKVPLKKMALPDDIAPSIVFLLSNEASYITGHNLIVDGGWSAV